MITDIDVEKIEFKITHRGPIKVNFVCYYKKDETICAVAIDLKNKYAEIASVGDEEDGSPIIYFGSNENTTNLRTHHNDNYTGVVLPAFKGWTVWSYHVSKSTAHLCLVKE